MKRCVSELGLPGIRRMTRGLRVGNRLVGAWRGVFEELATQSGHRRYQPAHVERIHRDVGLVAGVDGSGQLAGDFAIQRKSGGEKNQTFSTRNRREIFGQIANRNQQRIGAKLSFGFPEICHARILLQVGSGGGILHTGNIGIRNTGNGLAQAIGVGRKILHDLQAATEIHHRHHLIRAGVGGDEFRGCVAGPRLIARVHGSGVEKQNQVVPLVFHRRGGIAAKRKSVDRLLLVVFVDLEIFLGQVGDVVAFLVGDHHVHADFIGLGLDRVGVIGRRRLLLRRARRGRRWRLLLRWGGSGLRGGRRLLRPLARRRSGGRSRGRTLLSMHHGHHR